MGEIEKIYEQFYKLLENESAKWLKDKNRIQDVINDTFIHILLHRYWFEKQKPDAKQKYAISMCKKECEKYNSWNHGGEVEFMDSRPKENGKSEMKDFLQKTELEEILNKLDSKEAAFIKDFYLEGKSIAKIAAAYGISYDSAARRLSRIRKKIKNCSIS